MTIDLNPGAEQRQILDAARELLAAHFPLSRLHGGGPEPLDRIAGFGALGLSLPEAQGGAGLGAVEEALLHVEFGRHLVSPAVLATALAAQLAAAAGEAGLARALAAGQERAALAHRCGGGLQILRAEEASHALLWSARDIRLLYLRRLSLRPVAGIDTSLPLHRAAADEAATVAVRADAPLVRRAELLVSAQLLGVAEAVKDITVAYAGIRRQFGQPVGAFQAIKHRCADMAIRAEAVSAQLVMAAVCEQSGRPEAAFQTAALRRLALPAALANARAAVQVHGGIGFSAECDVHFFLKRAHALGLAGERPDFLAMAAPLAPLA